METTIGAKREHAEHNGYLFIVADPFIYRLIDIPALCRILAATVINVAIHLSSYNTIIKETY